MATIINSPGTDRIIHERTEDSGAGIVVGVILAILLVVLFILFGLPYMRNANTSSTGSSANPPAADINLNVRTPGTGTTGSGGSTGAGASGSVSQ